jgi:hypothetical protein
LVTGFINHLQIITTSNYSAVILQITRAHAKFSWSAFTSRFLVKDLNNFICSRLYRPVNISQLTPWLVAISHHPPTFLIDRTQLTAAESESETYVTTDGQSASLSWHKAPIWGLRPYFYHCQSAAGSLIWGALPKSFTIYNCCWPSLAQSSRVRVPLDS